MRKWMAALIIIGAALAAGGAAVPERAALAAPAKWSSRVLTPDGEDLYLNMGAVNPTTLAVAAPGSNGGSNLRQVYWRSTAPVTEGGTVCASWSMFPDTAQPGLAHNITPTSALTITRNVWAGAYWTLNVHTWNGPEFTGVAQMDWSDVVGGTPDHPYEPLPWRVCSQLSGSVLRVKLWFPLTEPEPSWGDDSRVKTVDVPSTSPGRQGWYVGHLPPGQAMVLTGLG